VIRLGQRSLPLGIVTDAYYREDRVQLEPGDTLVLYSDGLSAIGSDLPLDPEDVAAQIEGVAEIEAQRDQLVALASAGSSLNDDLTLVLVRRIDTDSFAGG
jgi:serine phosphatase RsbU (regulator of sigma subunit)